MFDSTALAPFAVRRCGRFPKRQTLKVTQGVHDFSINPEQIQMTNCSTQDLREGAHIFSIPRLPQYQPSARANFHGNRIRYRAGESAIRSEIQEAHAMNRRPVADNHSGIPIGRSRTVRKYAGGTLQRTEVAIRNHVMRACDRRSRIPAAVGSRPALCRNAKQTNPSVLDVHDLPNLQLPEPANVHGFVQCPAQKVRRASLANRTRVVRLFYSCRTAHEIHDPAVAVRVAHRAVMPTAGRMLLANIEAQIQNGPIRASSC